jgi:hypothetical protein
MLMQVELTNLLGTVQETERNMLEISALSNLFSTNVSHQTQQIKHLYEQVLHFGFELLHLTWTSYSEVWQL